MVMGLGAKLQVASLRAESHFGRSGLSLLIGRDLVKLLMGSELGILAFFWEFCDRGAGGG
jgi:hypothetical protein